MADTIVAQRISRQKRIDLASASAAAVLGAGVGAAAAQYFAPYAALLVAMGMLLHGWAMMARRRVEADVEVPVWAKALYWTCWIALGALAIWIFT
jgi:hypothetical protein